MTPTIDFIYNYEYAKRIQGLNDELFADPWQRIIRIGGDFEKLFDSRLGRILELVSRYSGYEWDAQTDAYIPVYMIGAAPSFVQPLSLAVDEDAEAMLTDCIYQLAHRNMHVGFPSDDARHRMVTAVTAHVLRKLGAETEPSQFDLNKNPAKHYIESSHGHRTH